MSEPDKTDRLTTVSENLAVLLLAVNGLFDQGEPRKMELQGMCSLIANSFNLVEELRGGTA